ncbi:MAG: MBL fold metallo-hydrolase [Thermodesulfovibrionia bacterium]
MRIRFLGGAQTVTGTCIHLSINGAQLLIDCGMYHGEDGDEINRKPFQFDPKEIDYVFLTHAHIDHSGLIPRVVKEGFHGRIITTSATADLTEIMLYDSAHLQEKDAEWLNKRALRAGHKKRFEPLYTVDDVRLTIPFFERRYYGRIEELGRDIRYRFIDAGHILGSASLEIWYQDDGVEKRIVFSGDIGKKGNPIINDPQVVEHADYVVIESTYGNRMHKGMEDSVKELIEAIDTTFKQGGNVLIPAFAVGRTQDILYTLNRLVREGRLKPLDVYVDSPLAEEATKVYLAHPECFDEEAMMMFQEWGERAIRLHFTTSVEDSQRINRIDSGAVIIAGSGMCDGGRIRHHLKHNLWRHECSIVFIGYQAEGTLGRRIVDGANKVHILGEEIAVNARVYTIGGFSAHADRNGLLEWLGAFKDMPEVFIIHGEEDVAKEFEKTVKETLGFITHIPRRGEVFEI